MVSSEVENACCLEGFRGNLSRISDREQVTERKAIPRGEKGRYCRFKLLMCDYCRGAQ
jgi:hypothetical protein